MSLNIKLTLCITLIVAVTVLAKDPLRFKADGTFKILQMTDIHYCDNPISDVENERIEKKLIEYEKPDLVVLTGDTVSGGADPKIFGHEWFKTMWRIAVRPMEETDTKWAWTSGNHDDEGLMTRSDIAEFDMSFPLSYTEAGPETITGVTNYLLPILPYEGDVPISNIWMLDSMGYGCSDVSPGYGCISSDVVEWYRAKVKETIDIYGHIQPSFAFFHIPLVELMNGWNVMSSRGMKGEPVCCPSANSGFYAAAHEIGDVLATSSGHDHDNDYFVEYHNITLMYGRKTGHASYGPPAGVQRGGRVIELTQAPFSWKTWIREENGTVVTEQPLHPPSETQSICCSSTGGPRKIGDWR